MILLLLIIFLPFINFISIWLLATFSGSRNAILFVIHSYIIVFLLLLKAIWEVCFLGNCSYISLGSWITCGLFIVNWGFTFDSLAVSMLATVLCVSILVHVYSIGYLYKDPALLKFISYLSLFTFFMFILVAADNFILLFLGWEGIGVCSYLLISFWNTRVQANKAGIKALLINRIGDLGLLFAILLIYKYFRTVDFATIFVLVPYFQEVNIEFFSLSINYLDCVCIFFVLGIMGKSAQLGLHTWLPDAMEGPSPVSALIHAATLVTAGIFLIIRCSPIFEYAPTALFFIALVGSLTAFIAATIALVQEDVKKTIAYSTMSQLGYMSFICGLSSYDLSLFHLINHAFFKALLFLSIGAVIHSLAGEQDIRKLGQLAKVLPYTYTMLLIGSLSLAGFPFLSGFFSKDLILETSAATYTIGGNFSYWLSSLTACLTAWYSFRVVLLTFFSTSLQPSKYTGLPSLAHTPEYFVTNIQELPKSMAMALFFLALGSIFSGFFFKDAFVGCGTDYWGSSLYVEQVHSQGLDFEFISTYRSTKRWPLYFSFLGIVCGYLLASYINYWRLGVVRNQNSQLASITNLTLQHKVSTSTRILNIIIRFFYNKWYFDYLYNHYIGILLLRHVYESLYKLLDKGFFEICGPTGISTVIFGLASASKAQQFGQIYHSVCTLFFSLLFLFVFVGIF